MNTTTDDNNTSLEQLTNEPDETYIKRLEQHRKESEIVINTLSRRIAKVRTKINGKKANYPERIFLEKVHEKMIVYKLPSDIAIQESITELSKDTSYYDDIKYYPIKDLNRSVIKKYKNTRYYRRLVSEGNLCTVSLKRVSSVQAHINMLNNSIKILERIDSLKSEVDILRKQTLSRTMEVNFKNMTKQDKIDYTKELRKEYSIKDIANMYNVTEKTVRRLLE